MYMYYMYTLAAHVSELYTLAAHVSERNVHRLHSDEFQ